MPNTKSEYKTKQVIDVSGKRVRVLVLDIFDHGARECHVTGLQYEDGVLIDPTDYDAFTIEVLKRYRAVSVDVHTSKNPENPHGFKTLSDLQNSRKLIEERKL